VDGNKYTRMHDQSIENLKKCVPGKTILDHATWVAGRTGDYIIRRAALGREHKPFYNRTFRLKNPNPEAMSAIVKEKAHWIGADAVGIARLNPLWIYTHWGMQNVMYSGAAQAGDPIEIPPDYQMVIVMIHAMDYDVIRRSPAVEEETDIGYSKAAWCASSLAAFISELGYKAIPACNELGISIAMAVDAGLGELGRNGQLITRDYGSSVRISKVFIPRDMLRSSVYVSTPVQIDSTILLFSTQFVTPLYQLPGAVELGLLFRREYPWLDPLDRVVPNGETQIVWRCRVLISGIFPEVSHLSHHKAFGLCAGSHSTQSQIGVDNPDRSTRTAINAS